MHRRISIWLFGLGIGIVLIASMLIVRSPIQANTIGCTNPNTSYECGLAKQTQMIIEDTSMAETALAIPTFTPVPTNRVPVKTSTPAPLPTVVIRSLVGDEFASPEFRGATSVWMVGTIRSTDPYEHIRIYVKSGRPSDGSPAYLAYEFQGLDMSKTDNEKYTESWFAPRDIGEITITGVTGMEGIVSFKTSTGVTGTFDLAKKTWSLK